MDFTINFSAINLLVVFAATVVANLLGGLWYSPIMFGKPWRKANNMTHTDGEIGGSSGTFVASFILHLVSASLLAALLGPSAGGMVGLQLGALIGFSFVMTAMGVTNLFEHRRSILILINSGYHIVSLSLVGYIIGQWG
jgi:ABC-type nitrate/sulfonate/bicarbonate transport system permease component